MAKNRINVGLSKETHEMAIRAAWLLNIDLQDMVDSAVRAFLDSRQAETKKRLKRELKQVSAAA